MVVDNGVKKMQVFKSIYYPKEYTKSNNSQLIRLAFNKEKDALLYKEVKHLKSSELRALLGHKSYDHLLRQANNNNRTLNDFCLNKLKKVYKDIQDSYGEDFPVGKALSKSLVFNNFHSRAGTFSLNKTEEIHRWYPYIEGYSCSFVEEILNNLSFKPNRIHDPFAGSGTTQIVASHMGFSSHYSEINPFMRFVIETKVNGTIDVLRNWNSNKKLLIEFRNQLLKSKNETVSLQDYFDTFSGKEYFSEEVVSQLLTIKNEIKKNKNEQVKKLLLLALASIAVEVSNMTRRADLRYKRDGEKKYTQKEALSFYLKKVGDIIEDIDCIKNARLTKTELFSNNSKSEKLNSKPKYDLVITSPPYVNGTNYFRNSKIELWLLDFIKNENDLKQFRLNAVASGINNISKSLQKPLRILEVEKLAKKIEKVAYDPRISKLILHYFSDMKKVFQNISNNLEAHGHLYLDIGDSQFAGVHVPTDEILTSIGKDCGLELADKKFLRKRYSKNGMPLKQVLLLFKKRQRKISRKNNIDDKKSAANFVLNNYSQFKETFPYRIPPYSKRNWGNVNHSLCSYQGKLKPSIAYFLVELFTNKDMKVLDPLGGVGTLAFEACLNGRLGISNDISYMAHVISLAKLQKKNEDLVTKELGKLEQYLGKNLVSNSEARKINISFNKSIQDYYHEKTFREILTARKYFQNIRNLTPEKALILSSLLHVLHGNRPYALSRRSHPIIPFAPAGEFVYKSVIEKINQKVNRSLQAKLPETYKEGKSFNLDFLDLPKVVEKQSIDAIITSPPFYNSTRFYLSNWIRMWFCGWDKDDFNVKSQDYLETKQKKNFNIYSKFFKTMEILLKPNGILIMHLGRSDKFNMGESLSKLAENYYQVYGLIDENVIHCEKFGIKDQGATKGHQYLFLIKK